MVVVVVVVVVVMVVMVATAAVVVVVEEVVVVAAVAVVMMVVDRQTDRQDTCDSLRHFPPEKQSPQLEDIRNSQDPVRNFRSTFEAFISACTGASPPHVPIPFMIRAKKPGVGNILCFCSSST